MYFKWGTLKWGRSSDMVVDIQDDIRFETIYFKFSASWDVSICFRYYWSSFCKQLRRKVSCKWAGSSYCTPIGHTKCICKLIPFYIESVHNNPHLVDLLSSWDIHLTEFHWGGREGLQCEHAHIWCCFRLKWLHWASSLCESHLCCLPRIWEYSKLGNRYGFTKSSL